MESFLTIKIVFKYILDEEVNFPEHAVEEDVLCPVLHQKILSYSISIINI